MSVMIQCCLRVVFAQFAPEFAATSDIPNFLMPPAAIRLIILLWHEYRTAETRPGLVAPIDHAHVRTALHYPRLIDGGCNRSMAFCSWSIFLAMTSKLCADTPDFSLMRSLILSF